MSVLSERIARLRAEDPAGAALPDLSRTAAALRALDEAADGLDRVSSQADLDAVLERCTGAREALADAWATDTADRNEWGPAWRMGRWSISHAFIRRMVAQWEVQQ